MNSYIFWLHAEETAMLSYGKVETAISISYVSNCKLQLQTKMSVFNIININVKIIHLSSTRLL